MFENDNDLIRDIVATTPHERAKWFARQLQDLINFECANPMLEGMIEWEAKKEAAINDLYDHLQEYRALFETDPAYARHYADIQQENEVWLLEKAWGYDTPRPEWPEDGATILRGRF